MKKTVKDVDVTGKRVFVRVDFNVPLDNGKITDETRVQKSLPTINYLREQGARVILASHLGRPKGQVKDEFRMVPVKEKLEELLKTSVKKSSENDPSQAEAAVNSLEDGEVLLLENLRFHPGEEENDEEFANALASLVDIYVNDAFGAAHRAHASTHGITQKISGECVAGLLMAQELKFLGESVDNPERPFVAVIGGAKISDKIGVIDRLIETANKVVIGGGMANTFLLAKGYQLGKSLVEEDAIDKAKELLKKADNLGVELMLPKDVVVAEKLEEKVANKTVKVEEIPENMMALDIGEETINEYSKVIKNGKTVIMNGPMGVFETEPFDHGTVEIAKAMGNSSGTTIVGGGDSVSAINKAGLEDKITHISTGGGASLKYLEGKPLPGVQVLQDR
ncbi:phosphoglycerate kinase [Natranaerobius thermophilus JW/NM-WN-LF]|uniref:Phosphoglycerate kinase n=2 Tax=Natranaerobius TaxID=375928 RepID=B2A6Z4_NATTJ|nr:phosphoglycerate kinase [Natranaerobius thermophilus]ACB85585.1 phosphoglycerate kinase [Natranaerobius thermophilus JW/NM-WN-LF]